MKIFWAVLLIFSVVLGSAVFSQEKGLVAERGSKRYFPGDFVHVVVEAPSDTTKITSLMPNSDSLELIHDRRAGVWYGLWQVPIGFRPGTYTAELQAKDMEGNTFTGETAPFTIGELTMITIVKKAQTPEVETRAAQSDRLALETARLAAKAKPAPKVKIKPPVRLKKMKVIEVGKKKDLLAEVKLIATTRYYMEKMDFNNVESNLRSLTKIDPANQQYRKMLRRVETVITTERNKKK